MEIFNIVVLSLSGLLLLAVSSMRLSNPIKAYAKNSGITLGADVNLLNEMRGVSALMLCGGIVIGLGAIIPQLTFTSFVVGILIFLGFGIGRMISMGVDGKPGKELVQGLMFELVFGCLNVFCLVYALL